MESGIDHPIPLFKTRTKTNGSFQSPLYRVYTSVFVWFVHPVKAGTIAVVAQAVKRIYCSVKQGVRRDLTYHIASMSSLSSGPIMSIRSNDIEEGSTAYLCI
jgi:hypothetical protein